MHIQVSCRGREKISRHYFEFLSSSLFHLFPHPTRPLFEILHRLPRPIVLSTDFAIERVSTTSRWNSMVGRYYQGADLCRLRRCSAIQCRRQQPSSLCLPANDYGSRYLYQSTPISLRFPSHRRSILDRRSSCSANSWRRGLQCVGSGR